MGREISRPGFAGIAVPLVDGRPELGGRELHGRHVPLDTVGTSFNGETGRLRGASQPRRLTRVDQLPQGDVYRQPYAA